MKKIFSMVVVAALMLLAAPSAHALMRKDMGLVRGKVIEYDHKTRTLVIDGNRGEGQVKFDLSAAQVTAPTNPGEEVVVIYKLQGNKATVVKYPPKK